MNRDFRKEMLEIYKKYIEQARSIKEIIEREKKELEIAIKNGNEKEIEKQKALVKYYEEIYRYTKSDIKRIRIPTQKDIQERQQIYYFISEVDRVIPSDYPIIFHGNGEIDSIEEILKSGGLFTQKERGMDVSWSSSLICACNKSDITIAVQTANLDNFFLPYGALFAIAPQNEWEKNRFNQSAPVISSFDFHTEPDRLVAIITTSENIDKFKEIAKKNGLNENIIMTHVEFLEMCKEKYTTRIK